MSDKIIRVYTPDDYAEQIDKMAESMSDRGIVLGTLEGAQVRVRYDEDENLKRLGEFVYPAELFADERQTSDLASADTQLVATGVFPEEILDSTAVDVIGYDNLKEHAREIATNFEDPIFFVGVFHPDGNYQMTGNPDNNKPRRLGSMTFPERVFDTDGGLAPLQKLHLGFPGTVVIEADRLTDETVAYARGDRDELPIKEREDDRMDPDDLDDLLHSLSEGDRVQINDRNRPLTVVPRSETTQIGVANHECVFLSGNGTDYRVPIPNRDGRYPKLEWKSDSEYIGDLEVVERAADGDRSEVPA